MKIPYFFMISVFAIITLGIIVQLPIASSDDFSGRTQLYPPKLDLTKISLSLNDTFQHTSQNSTKDLHFRFFDANNNSTINNVTFFINATKDGKVLMHDLFYTSTGSMTLKFSSGNDIEKWVMDGTNEPTLGGWMSKNDTLHIQGPAFTKGTYHIHVEVLSLFYVNELVDQNNPPKFDSWWSVDDKGNISQYDNSTISFGSTMPSVKIKDESPLKQFRMGIFAQGVQCNTGLQLFFKAEDFTPVCAQSGTATVLLKRGWATTHPPDPYVEKIAITGLQQNYTIGQPINAMINYAGYYWYTEPDVKISDKNGTQIWFNCPYCYTRSTPLLRPSLDAFTYIVRDYASNNLPVINKTGTYTMAASLGNRTASAEFTIVKSLMPRAGDIAISYNNTLYNDGTFYVKRGQNFTLMLNVTSNPVNVPVTLYTAPHSGFTKTNGIDFKLSDTRVNTPAKVMWYMSVSKDATPTTYGATVRLNDTDGMGSVTYIFHVTVK